MTANDVTNGILAGLTKVASFFVPKMKQKISQNNLPSNISDAISIGTAQTSGDISFIDIDISLKEAPSAAAWEWGSGEHAERGIAGKYIIKPHNKKALAFEWEGKGKVILPYVMHPGVAPRPYIAPTLIENKAEIRKILGKELKASIMLGVPAVTVIEVQL